MPIIKIETIIHAPIERCFLLSTSIDLHKLSTSQTKEQAIAGVTQGLIGLNETVTWRAKHFGLWHKLKVKITAYDAPYFFVDEMLEGTFSHMKHKHEFKFIDGRTVMNDTFDFSSPMGFIGKIVDHLILEKYMTRFVIERNQTLKEFAESDRWKEILSL